MNDEGTLEIITIYAVPKMLELYSALWTVMIYGMHFWIM
jgi:hypothetical protein